MHPSSSFRVEGFRVQGLVYPSARTIRGSENEAVWFTSFRNMEGCLQRMVPLEVHPMSASPSTIGVQQRGGNLGNLLHGSFVLSADFENLGKSPVDTDVSGADVRNKMQRVMRSSLQFDLMGCPTVAKTQGCKPLLYSSRLLLFTWKCWILRAFVRRQKRQQSLT